jgi:hypothetical protein
VKIKLKDERRGKMDEKRTNPIRTIERSESLSQGFYVVPLPSILSQPSKPLHPNTTDTLAESHPPD